MKKALALALVLALALSLAACGGGSSSKNSSKTSGKTISSAKDKISSPTPKSTEKKHTGDATEFGLPEADIDAPNYTGEKLNGGAENTGSDATTAQASPAAPAAAPADAPAAAPVQTVELTPELQAVVESKVQLDEEANRSFRDFVSGFTVTYVFESEFGLDEALERYYGMPGFTEAGEGFLSGKTVNVEKLKARIKENNEAFLLGIHGNMYSELTAAEFEEAFGYFIECLQFLLAQCDDIDLDALDAKLGALKLTNLENPFLVLGQVSDDADILALDFDRIAKVQKEDYPELNLLKKTASHETVHVVQGASKDAKEARGFSTNTGIAYKWDDLNANPLYCQWFYEGAADILAAEQCGEEIKEMVRQLNTWGGSYSQYVFAIESIALSALPAKDISPAAVANITLQGSIERLFALYGCETDADKAELCKLFFAFDIAEGKSHGDFYLNLKTKGLIKEGSSLRWLDYPLAASIAQSLTKTFYKSLSEAACASAVGLGDVFSFISVFENDLSRQIRYYDYTRADSNTDFFKAYVQIQDRFFAELGAAAGIEPQAVADAYIAYHAQTYKVQLGGLDMLDDGKDAQIAALSARLTPQKTSVREMALSLK
jgi:hypothetical protein